LFLSKDHRHLKLGDLNVAKVVQQSDSFAHTQAGTPYYASPEVWRDQPYDARCDIWSLGCVVYEMTALRPPFVAKDLESLAKKVVKGVYD
jgi:NIMA (never in mitosis gene a)-related kinase